MSAKILRKALTATILGLVVLILFAVWRQAKGGLRREGRRGGSLFANNTAVNNTANTAVNNAVALKVLDQRAQEDTELVRNGTVRLWMSDEQCRLAWGKPSRINQTTDDRGVHEQWLYDDELSLCFDNGVLTSIPGISREKPAATPASSVVHIPAATAKPTPRAPRRGPSDTVTLVRSFSIRIQYGSVTLPAGTTLHVVSRGADTVRVRYYDGADYDIPASATDEQ